MIISDKNMYRNNNSDKLNRVYSFQDGVASVSNHGWQQQCHSLVNDMSVSNLNTLNNKVVSVVLESSFGCSFENKKRPFLFLISLAIIYFMYPIVLVSCKKESGLFLESED